MEKPKIPLPKGWTGHVRSAVLHVIGLAQRYLVNRQSIRTRTVMRQLEKRMPATAAAFDLAHNGDELRELVEARILSGDPQEQTEAIAIAAAAKELDELRNRWLNPPEWTREELLEFPGSLDGPWKRYIDAENAKASRGVHPHGAAGMNPTARDDVDPAASSRIGTVRYPRIVAKDEEYAKQLKKTHVDQPLLRGTPSRRNY